MKIQFPPKGTLNVDFVLTHVSQHAKFFSSSLHFDSKRLTLYNLFELEVFKDHRNIFEHFWQRSEVFGKLSEIIGSGCDVFGNPGHGMRQKSHAFDSEKFGRYTILEFRGCCQHLHSTCSALLRNAANRLQSFGAPFVKSCV